MKRAREEDEAGGNGAPPAVKQEAGAAVAKSEPGTSLYGCMHACSERAGHGI